MYIHGIIDSSTANGPGNRCCVWFQGCDLSCRDCWNSDTHKHGIGDNIDPIDLYTKIASLENIEGITFSGGEPIQQAPALAYLLSLIRAGRPELSIGMYTGYSIIELSTGRFKWYDPDTNGFITGNKNLWHRIKSNLDFVVSGRFNKDQRIYDKPLCSSANQTLELLSSFYKIQDFEAPNIEITISSDGSLVNITGFPTQPNSIKEGL